jgi:hypothetical protein
MTNTIEPDKANQGEIAKELPKLMIAGTESTSIYIGLQPGV